MVFKNKYWILFVLLTLLSPVQSANAVIIDIKPGTNLYNLSPGSGASDKWATDPNDPVQTDNLDAISFRCTSEGCSNDRLFSAVIGYLPSNSMLSFSYNAPSIKTSDVIGISAYSYYDYELDGVHYYGASRVSNNGVLLDTHTIDGSPSDIPLVYLSAQLNDTETLQGTSIVKNMTDVNAYFEFSFAANISGLAPGESISTGYDVSAVPLPGALPLFGMGLMGLMAARRINTSKVLTH